MLLEAVNHLALQVHFKVKMYSASTADNRPGPFYLSSRSAVLPASSHYVDGLHAEGVCVCKAPLHPSNTPPEQK